jgi:hypothetical protein
MVVESIEGTIEVTEVFRPDAMVRDFNTLDQALDFIRFCEPEMVGISKMSDGTYTIEYHQSEGLQ